MLMKKLWEKPRFYGALALFLLLVSCSVNSFPVVLICRLLIIPLLITGIFKTKLHVVMISAVLFYCAFFIFMLDGVSFLRDVPAYFTKTTVSSQIAVVKYVSGGSVTGLVDRIFCRWIRVDGEAVRVAVTTTLPEGNLFEVEWMPNSKQVVALRQDNDLPNTYGREIRGILDRACDDGKITEKQTESYHELLRKYVATANELFRKGNYKLAKTKYAESAVGQMLNNLKMITNLGDNITASQIKIFFDGVIPFHLIYYQSAQELADDALTAQILSEPDVRIPAVFYTDAFGYQYNPRYAVLEAKRELTAGMKEKAVESADFIFDCMKEIEVGESGEKARLAEVCYFQRDWYAAWIYSPAVSEALELSIQLLRQTGDSKYRTIGRQLFEGFFIESEQGGLVLNNTIITYSFDPQLEVLDSTLRALSSMKAWQAIDPLERYKDRLEKLTAEFLSRLDRFSIRPEEFPQNSGWSLVYIGGTIPDVSDISNETIHRQHIADLEALLEWCEDPQAAVILDSWEQGYEYYKMESDKNGQTRFHIGVGDGRASG